MQDEPRRRKRAILHAGLRPVGIVTSPNSDTVRPAGEDTELALLERVAAGDRDAFETLYKLFQPKVHAFLRRMLSDSLTAEELTDDVMVVVWRDARRFAHRSKLSTWIFGIAFRKAVNALRRQRRRPREIPMDNPPVHTLPDASQGVELDEWIGAALEHLSTDHRTVIELTFIQGFSYQEIAEIVDCPVNTVKTRMFHARRRLKTVLAALACPEPRERREKTR